MSDGGHWRGGSGPRATDDGPNRGGRNRGNRTGRNGRTRDGRNNEESLDGDLPMGGPRDLRGNLRGGRRGPQEYSSARRGGRPGSSVSSNRMASGGVGKRSGRGPVGTRSGINTESIHKALDGDIAMGGSGSARERRERGGNVKERTKSSQRRVNRREKGLTQAEAREKIFSFMGDNYDPHTKSLKLEYISKHCPGVNLWTFGALIVDIIKSECPEIESLDLSSNKILRLSVIKGIADSAPDLTRVCLRNNQIASASELHAFDNLHLKELILEGNPIARQSDYRDQVAKMFTSLDVLDTIKVTKFGEEEEIEMPKTILFHSGIPDPIKGGVLEFLKKYYESYDGADKGVRLQIGPFYSPTATLSVTMPYVRGGVRDSSSRGFRRRGGGNSGNQNYRPFAPYEEVDRNLMNVKDKKNREKNLHMGTSDIVQMLIKLPPTIHSLQDMMVDLWQLTPTSIMVKMTGPLQEASEKAEGGSINRMFHRTLCLVPHGGGMVIQNDMISMMEPISTSQKRRKVSVIAPVGGATCGTSQTTPLPSQQLQPTVGSVGGVGGVVSPVINGAGGVGIAPNGGMVVAGGADEAKQKAAITELMQVTALNEKGAFTLLQQTSWNLQESAIQFQTLHASNQIPAQFLRV
eukprot:CFRG4315T1